MVSRVTQAMNLQPAPVPANAEGGGSSLLGSFVIAARQRGVHLSVPQLIRDHQLASGEVSTAQLLRIAGASGLRIKATHLRWASLVKLGTALPVIVLLRNGSAMVLLRIHRENQARPPIVVLQDPNAPQHAPLMLDEVRFTEAWDGDVIWSSATTTSATKTSLSASGSSWRNCCVIGGSRATSRSAP